MTQARPSTAATAAIGSPRAATFFAMATAATFFAASSAPTPLYHHYQEVMGLSPAGVTMIFAAYVLSLLVALLTLGSLSDHVGRRPVIFAALALNASAMILFAEAHSVLMLVAARMVQGLATGIATTAIGASILDWDRSRGALFNSLAVFAGLTLGALASGALVAFAPAPERLVYALLFALCILEALVLWRLPESAPKRPGALASLRPRVSVPPQARQSFLQASPVNIAAWALGGFYLSLMPSLMRVATGLGSAFVGGAVVAALTSTATLAVLLTRDRAASRMLSLATSALALGILVTLAGVHAERASWMLAGTMVAGFGLGSAFSGTVRTILPLAAAGERAGLLAAFYIESYLAFSLPAILAGFASPVLGLPLVTYIYGTSVILLALATLVALRLAAARPAAQAFSPSTCR